MYNSEDNAADLVNTEGEEGGKQDASTKAPKSAAKQGKGRKKQGDDWSVLLRITCLPFSTVVQTCIFTAFWEMVCMKHVEMKKTKQTFKPSLVKVISYMLSGKSPHKYSVH